MPRRRRPKTQRGCSAGDRLPSIGDAGGGDAVPPGLVRVREIGDGSCLFHALARQVFGSPDLARRVRTELCDWMQQHLSSASEARCDPGSLSPEHWQLVRAQRAELFTGGSAGGNARSLQTYVARMRRHSEWGTGLEALCAAYVYRRPVLVWSPDGLFSRLDSPHGLAKTGAEPIRLLHNGSNHWDSAMLIASSADCLDAGRDHEEDMSRAIELSLRDHLKESRFGAASAGRCDEATIDMARLHTDAASCALEGTNPSALAPLAAPARSPEEVAAQRALAAAAAEQRMQRMASRGLGPKAADKATVASKAKAATQSIEDSWPEALRGATSSSGVRAVVGGVVAPTAASASDVATVVVDDTSCRVLCPDDLENCMAALQRLGLSGEEAAEAIARCDADVEHVKALYSIEWDLHGRTLQLPFA